MTSERKLSKSRKDATPILEWALGAIGVALLVSCVAFLVYEGVINGERPGAVSATVKDIISTKGAYIVTFELHNAGSQTMSNVHVTAHLSDGTRETERVHTVIDYLPARSHQEGGFYFKNDPRRFELEIGVEGYQKP
jgi:uncharacterized protein (TIGR02588 family)